MKKIDLSLTSATKEYADLFAKRIEVELRRVALIEERRSIWLAIPNLPESSSDKKPSPDVAALLGEEGEAPPARAARERLLACNGEIQTCVAALALLDSRIPNASLRASAVIVERVRPEYRRRVQSVCEALATLENRYAEMIELIDQLNGEKVSWSQMRPLQAKFLDRPDVRDNCFRRYIKEAVEYKLCDPSVARRLVGKVAG